MFNRSESTRRDFLTRSAGLAAATTLLHSAASAQAADSPVPASATPKSPGEVLRIGFIGTGGRGGAQLQAVTMQKDVASLRVVAIADPFEPHRKKAAAKVRQALKQEPELYDGPEDYKRLIARDDIDVVFIATPCYLHARMYMECYKNGRHFYGEKPMAIDASDAKMIVAAQEKNPHVVAQIGFQRRASECYRQGVQHIKDGTLGPLVAGRAQWKNPWGPLGVPSDNDTSVWFGRREMSGDWMLEQACHSWDALCWAVGEMPIAATGRGRRDLFTHIDPKRDVTDYYLAQIEFPNGLLLDFEHNWICPEKADKVFTGTFELLQGPKGGIDLTNGKIYLRDKNAEPIQLAAAQSSGEMTVLAIKSFFESVRAGKPSISPVTTAQKATYTGLLVRKAVDEKRRVLMSEII